MKYRQKLVGKIKAKSIEIIKSIILFLFPEKWFRDIFILKIVCNIIHTILINVLSSVASDFLEKLKMVPHT